MAVVAAVAAAVVVAVVVAAAVAVVAAVAICCCSCSCCWCCFRYFERLAFPWCLLIFASSRCCLVSPVVFTVLCSVVIKWLVPADVAQTYS